MIKEKKHNYKKLFYNDCEVIQKETYRREKFNFEEYLNEETETEETKEDRRYLD